MIKLIKLAFWVCATIILAYFLTDFRYQGKTVKQNIDGFMQSNSGVYLKAKAKELVEGPVLDFLDPKTATKQAVPADTKPTVAPTSPKVAEEISNEDRNKLKGIIEKNKSQGEKK